MALVGNLYIQESSSDPGSVGFGYGWAQTDTANLYWRNTSNAAWVFAGNMNTASMGLLPLAGGTMTGAILGAHGLMPTAGGNFTVAPTILGNEVATKVYVDEQGDDVLAQISAQVAQALASQPVLSVNNKVAFDSGLSGAMTATNGITTPTEFTIPLPTYADGTTATTSEVAGRYGCFMQGASTGGVTTLNINETAPGSRTYTITALNADYVIGFQLGYYIMAIRA